MINIYDVTLTISADMPTWPGDPPLVLERVNKIEEGKNANVSKLSLSVHTGTHVDAPFHFLQDGGTVENLSLDVLIGAARVVEIPAACDVVNAEVLKAAGVQTGIERLLLKTRNSLLWEKQDKRFETGFVGVDLEGAEYLASIGIRLVGIDYLSIAPFRKSRPTHEVLLKANMVIIEGLNLCDVPAGDYQMYCLPLKLADTDGAPARVILTTQG